VFMALFQKIHTHLVCNVKKKRSFLVVWE